jgi:hypothetical protein
MELAELNEQSTKEEVNSYVEEVVEEVAADRAGEKQPAEKGDARITAEHADNEHKEIPAEEKSGSETAKSKDEGEESGEEQSEAEWLDDDLKAEVAAYGIEESELADFASREELERALRLFDKSALEAGRKALADQGKTKADGETVRNEKGQFVKQDAPQSKPAKQDGAYEIKLSKEVYDAEIVEEFTRLRDHYESRLDAMESRFAEADAKAEEQHFDGLVDSLGHADLFGKSGQEGAKQLQRRQDLHVAVKAQMLGLAQLGRPTDLNESLVNRVARMVFADDLGKKDLKNRTRKITKQSNGRQGGGATRPQDPRTDPRDEADRLYKELAGS